MDIFLTGLGILSMMCVLIYKGSIHPECRDPQFAKFKRTYLFVYLLATGTEKQQNNSHVVYLTCGMRVSIGCKK